MNELFSPAALSFTGLFVLYTAEKFLQRSKLMVTDKEGSVKT